MSDRVGQARTAAVTGAGSGLGREIALLLAAKDYRVFGTGLVDRELDHLSAVSNGRVSLSLTDITDGDAVTTWVRNVADEVGEAGLDVLVSNAGILTPGPLEVLPLRAIKREFDVNVFGALAVINAFLPALRTARGRIVAIGSMTGRFPLPFNGPSSASKATLEALADVYRSELKPFGVQFVLAQPGNMVTGGPAKTAAALQHVADSMTDEQKALYGTEFAKFSEAFNSEQSEGLSAREGAARVVELVEEQPAPIRAAIGEDAEKLLHLVRENSDEDLDVMRRWYAGLA
jgi:NAD(P)-dependent dehydrogenase (short-subunit alcohol dehydrogenase family)